MRSLKVHNIKLHNRYGDKLWLELVEPDLYRLGGEAKYCRFGGKQGQDYVDYDDLGFFDPSGGPFISEGYPVEGKAVKQIMCRKDGTYFRVE
jgi:hypothetical protein